MGSDAEKLIIHVSLPSGRSVALSAPASSSVLEFETATKQSLKLQFLELIHTDGSKLSTAGSLQDAGLVDGDTLTAIVQMPQIAASNAAFALCCCGSVVAWGEPKYGADSSAVQDQLRNVQQIQASARAFTALLADGSVVTWGHPGEGGDSSAVQEQLKDVQRVQASSRAFAAILADGSVVTWGHPEEGGDSSAVQDQLRNVQQVQASAFAGAFAAILVGGSVVAWGDPDCGGDSSVVQDQLRNVQQIQASL